MTKAYGDATAGNSSAVAHGSHATWLRRPHRSGRRPRPGVAETLLILAMVGLGATMGVDAAAESRGALAAAGGVETALGQLAGLVGTYLMMLMVVFMARLPVLERAVGQDRLVRWHRRIGGWPILLIAVHAVLITLGYAAMDQTGPMHQLGTLLRSYPDVLAATVSFGLLVMVGVTSYRRARARMSYETWWSAHLYTYLALCLAFPHQLANGQSFVGHPIIRIWWAAMWVGTVGLVLAYRIGLPVWRSVYHSLRVVQVTEEIPGIFSIVCAGRHIERLAVSGGQFFSWHFMARGLWWQAHPYSLSALPNPPYIRVTVKDLGDHSRSLASLKPGTRVGIQGPYGAFTPHASSFSRVVLIAAGVGVTPIRALLEDLSKDIDVVVLVRASKSEDLIFRDEIAALVAERHGRLHELVGGRSSVRMDAKQLVELVPDLCLRDAYVCGPSGFTSGIVASLREAGMPSGRIHHEEFAF